MPGDSVVMPVTANTVTVAKMPRITMTMRLVFTLLLVSVVTFLLAHLMPGDPVLVVRAEEGFRLRLAAPHGQQPDR